MHEAFSILKVTAKRKTLLSEAFLRNIASTNFLNNQRVRRFERFPACTLARRQCTDEGGKGVAACTHRACEAWGAVVPAVGPSGCIWHGRVLPRRTWLADYIWPAKISAAFFTTKAPALLHQKVTTAVREALAAE